MPVNKPKGAALCTNSVRASEQASEERGGSQGIEESRNCVHKAQRGLEEALGLECSAHGNYFTVF